MFGFIRSIFAWWHGATLGTRLFTWQKGEEVGRDDQGYYLALGETLVRPDAVSRIAVSQTPQDA